MDDQDGVRRIGRQLIEERRERLLEEAVGQMSNAGRRADNRSGEAQTRRKVERSRLLDVSDLRMPARLALSQALPNFVAKLNGAGHDDLHYASSLERVENMMSDRLVRDRLQGRDRSRAGAARLPSAILNDDDTVCIHARPTLAATLCSHHSIQRLRLCDASESDFGERRLVGRTL